MNTCSTTRTTAPKIRLLNAAPVRVRGTTGVSVGTQAVGDVSRPISAFATVFVFVTGAFPGSIAGQTQA
jgi:hypothetical protein